MPSTLPILLILLLVALPARAGDWENCLAGLRSQALAQGIRSATLDQALHGLQPDPGVLEAMQFQPESRTPIWDYLAAMVDEERVSDGRARLATWSATLDALEARYGVDRHVLIAFWGIETDYGRVRGSRPLLRSLATGACTANRRRAFFRGEFSATLKIIESGDIAPDALTGSWAGAFGHTQFIPSTFLHIAVDFDGDGRRDIVHSVPDALASTAHYMRRAGWVSGEPWGMEVLLPAGFHVATNRAKPLSLNAWAARGLRRSDGRALGGSQFATLLLPAGSRGPAFLAGRNHKAIRAYNASDAYALAVALLSNRLRGQAGPTVAWPTDDRGLSRAERREVQRRLGELGFDTGPADGLIGVKTRTALQTFQKDRRLPVDGRAGGRVLDALRAPPP